MEGLDFDHSRVAPPYWGTDSLVQRVDAELWEALAAIEGISGGRVLLVGLPSAALGRFFARGPEQLTLVTVDAAERAMTIRAVEQAGRTRTTSVHGRSYAEIQFERSSFDVAILYDCLCRYAAPVNVLRKCAREVKMAGEVGLRVDLDYSPADAIGRFADEARLPLSLRRLLARLTERDAKRKWGLDWSALEAGTSDLLRFHTQVPTASIAPFVANAVARGGRMAAAASAGLMSLASRVDPALRQRAPSVMLAIGAKDVGFGKVTHAIQHEL